MLDILKIFERRSNNSIIAAKTTTSTRELASLLLLTKLKLTGTTCRLRDELTRAIFKIKSLVHLTLICKDRSDHISKAFVQNIIQSTALENLGIAYFWVRFDDLKIRAIIKTLRCFGFASVSGMSYYDERLLWKTLPDHLMLKVNDFPIRKLREKVIVMVPTMIKEQKEKEEYERR